MSDVKSLVLAIFKLKVAITHPMPFFLTLKLFE